MRMKTLTAILGALSVISIIPAAHSEIASRAYVDDKVTDSQNQMIEAAFGDNETFQTVMEKNGSMKGYIDSMKGYIDNKVTTSNDTIITGTDESTWEGLASDLGMTQQEVIDEVESKGLAGVYANYVLDRDGLANDISDVQSQKLNKEGWNMGILQVADGSDTPTVITGINSSHIYNRGISMNSLYLPTVPAECSATGGTCSLIYVGGRGFAWEVLSRGTNESTSGLNTIDGGTYSNSTQNGTAAYPDAGAVQ